MATKWMVPPGPIVPIVHRCGSLRYASVSAGVISMMLRRDIPRCYGGPDGLATANTPAASLAATTPFGNRHYRKVLGQVYRHNGCHHRTPEQRPGRPSQDARAGVVKQNSLLSRSAIGRRSHLVTPRLLALRPLRRSRPRPRRRRTPGNLGREPRPAARRPAPHRPRPTADLLDPHHGSGCRPTRPARASAHGWSGCFLRWARSPRAVRPRSSWRLRVGCGHG